MKNKLLLGALLISAVGAFTGCSDDNDSNPTLIQPKEFKLDTPAYVNETVDLSTTEALQLSWSQPQYTADNAPINAVYEVQLSLTNSFTVSYAEALADESGATVADYIAIDKTSTTCVTDVAAVDFNKVLMQLAQWTEDAVPTQQAVSVRVNAFVQEGTNRLNAVASNVVTINVNPYYVELRDAEPIMFYLIGDIFGDGSWSTDKDMIGVSTFPLFIQSGYSYDKATGAGEIVYLNYFTTGGWKMNPSDLANWDYGFMSGGSANTAVFRNGGGDGGNISCNPAGYYLVTVNTADNTCVIAPQDITPKVYNKICITGSFNEWVDADMTSVNKEGENHVWCYELTVDEDAVEQIKFKIPASWDTNWGYGAEDGEVNTCGKATNDGKNIGVPAGTWIIMFNDITGEFSIIAKQI